jgi:hypothetical protein
MKFRKLILTLVIMTGFGVIASNAQQGLVSAGGGDTFIVDATSGVDLIAGQSILMLPGTMVEYGGYLSVRISTRWIVLRC